MNPISNFIEKIDQQNLWDNKLELSRKEHLKVKGSIDTNLYFVVSGSLRIYVLDEFEENIIRFGYKNNFIASLDCFISEQPSDLYIQAIKKTELNKSELKSSQQSSMTAGWEIKKSSCGNH